MRFTFDADTGGMGFKSAMESAGTSAKDRAAMDRDRRAVEQSDQIIGLLTDLLAEQRRTNQLLQGRVPSDA